MGTVEISEFLTARLKEDETAAKDAACEASSIAVSDDEGGLARWRAMDGGEGITTESAYAGAAFLVAPMGYLEERVAEHVARHDPARVLADIAAKRAVVEHFKVAAEYAQTVDKSQVGVAEAWRVTSIWTQLLHVVKLLAAPYADHPDFRPDWKVEADD